MKYKRLKEELQNRNMSVRQLAITAGIIPQALYAALNGNAKFWPGYKRKVADALGVPEADLFEDEVHGND